jgi:hypothetical protein
MHSIKILNIEYLKSKQISVFLATNKYISASSQNRRTAKQQILFSQNIKSSIPIFF